jgi:hypothetical protein
MIKITEVLPNPKGADKGGEYIVLFNNSSQTIQLAGWRLKDASGKSADLSRYVISGGGQLKLTNTQTGISLNNSSESVALINPAGTIADFFAYNTQAAEGVPFFHNAELTPEIKAMLFDEFVPHQPSDAPVRGGAVLLMIVAAAILAGIAVYIVKQIKDDPVTNG